MRRVFFLAILLAFIGPSFGATSVLFLNGIDGDPDKNLRSSEKIKGILREAGYLDQVGGENALVGKFDNPADGWFDDKVELAEQAAISASALTLARMREPDATVESERYIEVLGSIYGGGILDGRADSEVKRQVYSVVRKIAERLREELLVVGNRVVVVSHSQGNFFAEAVHALLLVNALSEAERASIKAGLRFVGAASVAASTPHGRYVSAREDLALGLHETATAAIPNFSVLARNARLCPIIDVLDACKLALSLSVDPVIHGFQEVYTSGLEDRISGKTMAQTLADLINDSLSELLRPPSDVITFVASGIVTGISGSVSPLEVAFPQGYQAGTPVTFEYTFSASESDIVPNQPSSGIYRIRSAVVTIGSNTPEQFIPNSGVELRIEVENNAGIPDRFDVYTVIVGNADVTRFYTLDFGSRTDVFPDDRLPLSPPDLSLFEPGVGKFRRMFLRFLTPNQPLTVILVSLDSLVRR